ncbi:hypothetical protein ABZ917_17245 [Nonomuraea wenchangensis]
MRSHLTALRRHWKALRLRVGHRGAFLFGLAVLDYASAYRLANPDPTVVTSPAYEWLASLAPLPVWATAWSTVGTLALVQAFMQHDALAYGAAMALKVMWAGVYLLGWLVHDLPQGYFSVAIWAFAAWMVYVVATWPEPTLPDLDEEESVER